MLRIHNLNKSYGNFKALNDMELSIEKGELFGFVGPNGAGKTTTMRIVAGLLKADSGEVYVGDIDAIHDNKALKSKMGYMPDFFGTYDNLKAIEYMEFYASIYGIEGAQARKLCMDLMELVNLADKSDSYVDGLSRGMKQRLCLARSLIHNPELLMLDEPASGLDPRARFEMKEILKNLISMGKTIIISSHILPELAEMCSSIGIIEKGQIAIKGTVEDILSTMRSANPLTIKFVENMEQGLRILKEHPLSSNISIRENSVSLTFEGDVREEANLLKLLVEQGVMPSSYTREQGNLESVFMQITGNEEGEVS